MYNRCSLKTSVLVASIAILVIVLGCADANKDLTPEKMKKAFVKIDQLLVKHVPSDDMKLNVAALRELLETKSSSLMYKLGASSSTIEPLNQLSNFAAERWDCGSDLLTELAATIDSGLPEDVSQMPANHQPSRVQKIVDYYAYQEVVRCGDQAAYMPHAHRQLAYDTINTNLIGELPETEDAEVNLVKAEEMLQKLSSSAQTKDGSLARALQQFVELKSLLSEKSCDDPKSLEVMVKNDLGTRKNIHYVKHPSRRIDRVYAQVLIKHEQVCRPIYFDKLKGFADKLEPKAYMRVLRLVANHFLYHASDDKIDAQMAEKKVDQDFSIPLLKENFEKNLDNKNLFETEQYKSMNKDQLYRLLEAATVGHSDNKYLHHLTPEGRGEVKNIFHIEIVEKCQYFLTLFGGPIELAEFAVRAIPDQVLAGYEEHLDAARNYHMMRAGYYICKHIIKQEGRLYTGILTIIARSEEAKA